MGGRESVHRRESVQLSNIDSPPQKRKKKELSKVYLRWTELHGRGEAPDGRYAHGMAAVGSKIYIFGGYNGSYDDGRVYTFNTDSLVWEKPKIKGNPPHGRGFHSCVAIGNNIYFIGGSDGTYQTNQVLVLDTDTMCWKYPRTRGSIPPPRYEHSVTAVRSYIFLFGGGNSLRFFNDLYFLDTDSMVWSRIDYAGDQISNRCSQTFFYLENSRKIVIFGGYDGHKRKKDSYLFDPDTMTLKKMRNPSPGRLAAHTSCHLEDSLLIIGGFSPKFGRVNQVHMVSVDHGQIVWSEPNIRGTPPCPRSYHTTCTIDRKVYLFGGYAGSKKKCSDLFVLEPVLPTLVDLCVAFIIKNQHLFPNLSQLPVELQEYFVEIK